MKNNKGISLITLIVTIMVMLILIGVVGNYSLETIQSGNEAVAAREFANVREYVLRQQTRVENGDFEIDETEYTDLLLNVELAYLIGEGKLTNSELSNIVDVNSADVDAKYKYYYFQAANKDFEDDELSGGNITVQDVKNDYIVNFYSGTIICVTDENFKVEGLIKGLGEVLNDMQGAT